MPLISSDPVIEVIWPLANSSSASPSMSKSPLNIPGVPLPAGALMIEGRLVVRAADQVDRAAFNCARRCRVDEPISSDGSRSEQIGIADPEAIVIE